MDTFVQLAYSVYDGDGMPRPTGEMRRVAVRQIVVVDEHLGNNLFRRLPDGGRVPEQHYPCLLVTAGDGREHLVALGIVETAQEGGALLATAVAELAAASADM